MSHRWIVRETSTSLSSVQRFIRLYREDKGRGLLPQGVPVAKKQVVFFCAENYGSNTNNIVHVNCNGFKTLKYFFQAIPKRKVTEENKADGKHKTCKSSDGMP